MRAGWLDDLMLCTLLPAHESYSFETVLYSIRKCSAFYHSSATLFSIEVFEQGNIGYVKRSHPTWILKSADSLPGKYLHKKNYRRNCNVAPRCCSYLLTLMLSGKIEKQNSGPQVFRKQLLLWNKQTPKKTKTYQQHPTTDNNFTVSKRGFSAWSEVGVIHKPSISKLLRKVRVGRTNMRNWRWLKIFFSIGIPLLDFVATSLWDGGFVSVLRG